LSIVTCNILSVTAGKLREVDLHPWMESDELMSGADIFARIGQAVVDSRVILYIGNWSWILKVHGIEKGV